MLIRLRFALPDQRRDERFPLHPIAIVLRFAPPDNNGMEQRTHLRIGASAIRRLRRRSSRRYEL